MKKKRWIQLFLVILIILICFSALLVYAVDPWFHYHKPLEGWYYSLSSGERYQNDGILRNFDYDAVIIGSSMVDNFRTSEMDELFDCSSVKVPNPGSTYYENSMELKRSLSTHQVRYVVRSLDYRAVMIRDKDSLRTENGAYPMYLYNDNPFDDVQYLLNGEMIVKDIFPMIRDKLTGRPGGILPFDEYDSFVLPTGRAAVLGSRAEWNVPETIYHLSEQEANMIRGNMKQNITDLAAFNPDTEFFCFFPPYSAAYYGERKEEGNLEKYFEMEKTAVEELLNNKPQNLHLFWWNDHYDMTGDLNRYKDSIHYDAQANKDMLVWIKEGEGELTLENYNEKLQNEYTYYHNFDFDSLLN